MKTSVVKVAACCLFSFTALSVAQAGSSINVNDTSVKSMAYVSMKEDQPYIVVKKANVVYPAILSGHEEQSAGYVEKFSQARKDYLIRTFNRSKKLFPKAVAILKKYNIPSEFRVLLALESGFNANAVSKAGAVGYWQFMDEVAREYGLKIETRVKAPKVKAGKGKKNKQKTETASGS
ncbi:MAG: transglycosylase SLT domain-containing protein [Ferruginibacter sp.]